MVKLCTLFQLSYVHSMFNMYSKIFYSYTFYKIKTKEFWLHTSMTKLLIVDWEYFVLGGLVTWNFDLGLIWLLL